MPLDTASAAGLVAGAPGNGRGPAPPVYHARLLRAICVQGTRVEAGAVVSGDRAFISMLVGSNKAVRCDAPATPAPPPAPAAPAPATAGAAPHSEPDAAPRRRAAAPNASPKKEG